MLRSSSASGSGTCVAATKDDDVALYTRAVRTGAAVLLAAGLGVAISGDIQGKIMTEVQPMKMAAAEGLYDTETSADFSLLTIGSLDGSEEKFSIKIPGLLSFLGTGSTDGTVEGINQLREQYQETYGQDPGEKYYSPGDYTPIIPLTYWTFRIMIGLGLLAAAIAGWILLAHAPRADPAGQPHSLGRHRAAVPAALRQLLRLDLHRDGPPAVGRLRTDDHRPVGVTGSEHVRGRSPH